MFGISLPELVLVMVLGLLVFGPERVPKVALWLGRGIRQMRGAANELRQSLELEELKAEFQSAIDPSRAVKAKAAAGPGATTAAPSAAKVEGAAPAAVAPPAVFTASAKPIPSVARALESQLAALQSPAHSLRRLRLSAAAPASSSSQRRPLPASEAPGPSSRRVPCAPAHRPRSLRRQTLPPRQQSLALLSRPLPKAGPRSATRLSRPLPEPTSR